MTFVTRKEFVENTTVPNLRGVVDDSEWDREPSTIGTIAEKKHNHGWVTMAYDPDLDKKKYVPNNQ